MLNFGQIGKSFVIISVLTQTKNGCIRRYNRINKMSRDSLDLMGVDRGVVAVHAPTTLGARYTRFMSLFVYSRAMRKM
jgi:hypothetical protein